LEIDRLAERRLDLRVGRGDALHAGARVAVAIGAGFAGGARRLAPQRGAAIDPEKAWIAEVVVLHRLGLGRQIVVAGARRGRRGLFRARRCRRHRRDRKQAQQTSTHSDTGTGHVQATTMSAVAWKTLPSWSNQRKSNRPESWTRAKNVM